MRILSAGLILTTCGACATRPAAAPSPSLPPPSVPVAPPPAVPPPAPPPAVPPQAAEARTTPAQTPDTSIDEVQVCVLKDGELAMVPVQVRAVPGDTLYQGLPLSRAFPVDGAYAGPARWFQRSETIRFRGRGYVKYGLVLELGIGDVRRIGEYRGVGVYGAALAVRGQTEVIYLPVSTGCLFQAYLPLGRM